MSVLSILDAQQRLLPEMFVMLQRRYDILQRIHMTEPVGRRALADILKLTERDIRSATDILRQQRLIEATKAGMLCTAEGLQVLEQLKQIVHEMSGLATFEKKIQGVLQIERVVIVPGNSAEDNSVKALLGKEAAAILTGLVTEEATIAVTGGSSVAALKPFLQPNALLQASQFVAARGGIGDELQLHANTIVADFAKQANAQFKTLYLPENLSEQAYQMLMQEPMVKEMIELYNKANIIIHGIGSAEEMAKRRSSSNEEITFLQNKGAVSEAFGYYFDSEGNIVHQIDSIGIRLAQVQQSEHCIAIAGGSQKVAAIRSYLKIAPKQTTLITDEEAAKQLLACLS